MKQELTASSPLRERGLFLNTLPTITVVFLSLMRQKPGDDAFYCEYFVLSCCHLISSPTRFLLCKSIKHTYMPGSGDTRWINVCLKKLPVPETFSHTASLELQLRTPNFHELSKASGCLTCLSETIHAVGSYCLAGLGCQKDSASLSVLTQAQPFLGA